MDFCHHVVQKGVHLLDVLQFTWVVHYIYLPLPVNFNSISNFQCGSCVIVSYRCLLSSDIHIPMAGVELPYHIFKHLLLSVHMEYHVHVLPLEEYKGMSHTALSLTHMCHNLSSQYCVRGVTNTHHMDHFNCNLCRYISYKSIHMLHCCMEVIYYLGILVTIPLLHHILHFLGAFASIKC